MENQEGRWNTRRPVLARRARFTTGKGGEVKDRCLLATLCVDRTAV
jgi:hypothetical protein